MLSRRYGFASRYLQGGFRGWGYEDFAAGAITTTSVTISDNENGTDAYGFDSSNIINGSGICVLADTPAKKAYTGTSRVWSTKVAVSAHTGAAITLTGVPHANWGDIRIYYFYDYPLGVPRDYQIPSKAVAENLFAELQGLMITEEEIGDGSKDAVFNSIENTPVGAATPSTGKFTSLEFTGSVTGTIDHTVLSNIGTNSHVEIDTHLSDNSQAHSDYLLNNANDITNGTLGMATGSTVGTLTLADGSITDSGGAISFGNETLSTSGSITGDSFITGSDIGVSGDIDLLQLVANQLTVNGDIIPTGYIKMATDRSLSFYDGSTYSVVYLSGYDLIIENLVNGSDIKLWTVNGEVSVAGDLTVTTGTVQAEQLTSTDDITMQGHLLTLGDNSATDIVLSFDGSANDATVTYDESADLFISTADISTPRLVLADLDTYIELRQADSMTFTVGGVEFMRLDEALFTDIMYFNYGGVDIDFNFRGASDDNLIFANAGTDKVGFGDNAPGEKVDVAGNINLTGVLKVDDVQVVKEQQAHIANAPGDTTANNATTINAILTMLETHGLVASA